MFPFYRGSHRQQQIVSAPQYPRAAPHALVVPHEQPSYSLDETIQKRYADSDRKLRDAISRAQFPNPEARQQCLHFIEHLRIHRNLFMHTYIHMVSCCRGRYLHLLVESANVWNGWNSVQQLMRHASIKGNLLDLLADCSCRLHNFLLARPLVISDDENDLLYHLLYCVRKPELYAGKDLTQVVELLWQFLMKPQETNVERRLRAFIYRMARKSAYFPHDLRIAHPFISNRQDLVSGANGLITKATMNGCDVVIKKILCHDRHTKMKCIEMFAGEAILWKTLQHKNILPFLGVVMEGTFDVGLVSPFMRNGNVRNYITRHAPKLWPGLARGLARDLAEGLAYIHCHQPPIIHGDLKGDNVLVDDAGNARLSDFGQSYASDSGKYLDSTRVGLAANPVHWMAPELMLGDDRAKASDKSDIYSFGCVLYEMVSGKIPFEGLALKQVSKYVANGGCPNRPESLSRDHDRLWKIAKSCWEHRPEARPSATRLVLVLH